MPAVKITQKPIGTPGDDTHFIVTQPELPEGYTPTGQETEEELAELKVESVREIEMDDMVELIQDKLDMDVTPTTGSSKPVTSGGIKAALDLMDDDISSLNEDITNLIMEPEETSADLYICDPDGNVVAELRDGHIVTKNFDSASISIDVIMESSSSAADLYICDTFGSVIAELKNGHIVTKKFNSADYTNVLSSITDLQIDVGNLQNATSGIIARNAEAIEAVYASCRWKRRVDHGGKNFCMAIGGDIHGGAASLANMVTFINSIEAVDAGMMLGDIVGSNWADDATFYTDGISGVEKPFLTVIGNHDAGGNTQATGYTDIADLCAKFITPNIQYADLASGEYTTGNTYYYKDFADYKIRVIVLNQYEYPSDFDSTNNVFVYVRGNECYSQAQVAWLVNTLYNTPTDYGVIIALHAYPAWMLVDKSDPLTDTTETPSNISRLISYTNGFWIEDLVHAWVTGTALQQTYDYTVSGTYGTSISVNANFSSRGAGEFITFLGGHWHKSIMAATHEYGYKHFTVPATGLYASQQSETDTPRCAGIRSEDEFCVLSVDRDAKKVNIVFIGAHFTKDATDRLYNSYSYDIS